MFQVIGGIASFIYRGKLPGSGENQDQPDSGKDKDFKNEVRREDNKTDDLSDDENVVDVNDYQLGFVKDIVVYPCRGAQGIHLLEAKITESGIELDREWFVLEKEFDINTDPNKDKRFVSLTKNEPLGVVGCNFEEKDGHKYLVFSHPNMKKDLKVDVNNPPKEEAYTFYNNLKELITAYSEGEEAEKWIQEATGMDVVLARTQQITTADTYKEDYHYQYKEGDKRHAGHLKGALHIINEKSVNDLQSHIDEKVCKVTTDMFRANIVIDGPEAWDEDELREFELDGKDASFRVTYNSKRCKIANYEISKGKRNEMGEPLHTLNKLKHLKGIGPVFGCFVQPDKECEIKIGDKVRYTRKLADKLRFDEE